MTHTGSGMMGFCIHTSVDACVQTGYTGWRPWVQHITSHSPCIFDDDLCLYALLEARTIGKHHRSGDCLYIEMMYLYCFGNDWHALNLAEHKFPISDWYIEPRASKLSLSVSWLCFDEKYLSCPHPNWSYNSQLNDIGCIHRSYYQFMLLSISLS